MSQLRALSASRPVSKTNSDYEDEELNNKIIAATGVSPATITQDIDKPTY